MNRGDVLNLHNRISCLALSLRKDLAHGDLVVNDLRHVLSQNISLDVKCKILKTCLLASGMKNQEEVIFRILQELADSWWSGEVSNSSVG